MSNRAREGVAYKVTNLVNGKIYIGKTVAGLGRRWDQHKDYAKHKPHVDTYLYRAMRKHGIHNFSIEIIDRAEDDIDLCRLEMEWISRLRATDRTVGYNGTLGGQSGIPSPAVIAEKLMGRPCSAETRAKISAAHKGRKPSPERYAKMLARAAALKGKPVSPERAAAMRANPPGLGTKRTPEQRKRMSEGIKAAWTPELRAKHSINQRASRARSPRPGHKPTPENIHKFVEASRVKRANMSPEDRAIMLEKIASSHRGRVWSEEVVQRRAASNRAAWTPEKRADMAERMKVENARRSALKTRLLNGREGIG